jgi:hypothetical protein
METIDGTLEHVTYSRCKLHGGNTVSSKAFTRTKATGEFTIMSKEYKDRLEDDVDAEPEFVPTAAIYTIICYLWHKLGELTTLIAIGQEHKVVPGSQHEVGPLEVQPMNKGLTVLAVSAIRRSVGLLSFSRRNFVLDKKDRYLPKEGGPA